MAEKCYRSELIGLFGCPVDENPTVVIIEAAFKALGLNYRYNTMLVYPGRSGNSRKIPKSTSYERDTYHNTA